MLGILRTMPAWGGMLLVSLSGPALAGQEGTVMAAKTASLYDFTMDDIDGKPVNLDQYRGKVLPSSQHGQLLRQHASVCGSPVDVRPV